VSALSVAAGMGSEACGFLAAFARSAAWLQTAPLTGDSTLSPKLRTAMAALMALPIAAARGPLGASELFAALPGELLLGAAIGLAARVEMAGAEAGGQLLGLELELGFAGTFDPMAREEALPTRRLASCLAGLAFLGLDGLELSARSLATPPISGHSLQRALGSLIDASADVLPLAVRAAAPMMVAAVIANVAVALASRAAPALNVFSVMLALVLVIGALALTATAPAFVREMALTARHAIDAATQVTR
jgi:flagellar biosynthetic protein FliR